MKMIIIQSFQWLKQNELTFGLLLCWLTEVKSTFVLLSANIGQTWLLSALDVIFNFTFSIGCGSLKTTSKGKAFAIEEI